jgi:hypothetical protein
MGEQLIVRTSILFTGTWRRVVLAFSLRKNMRTLLDTSSPEDELSCVHGLRALASLFIYIIHRSVFAMFYPFSNRTQVAEVSNILIVRKLKSYSLKLETILTN